MNRIIKEVSNKELMQENVEVNQVFIGKTARR